MSELEPTPDADGTDTRGDLHEDCCPHCGFCADEHPVLVCADCITPPEFVHDDNEHCMFLGHFDGHDLYVHHAGEPTYVARHSDNPPDYTSGAVLVGRDARITEAHRLATLRGIELTNVPGGSTWAD